MSTGIITYVLSSVNQCDTLFSYDVHTMEVDVEKIVELRVNQGLTQRELARRAGVSNTSLWKIERGGGATPPTLKKLADVLGVKPVDLLRR